MTVCVIGAGVTGLAAGMTSGAPVFEQSDGPGGICRSYYVRPATDVRLDHAPPGDDAYRFEVGGGHWIFGSDPDVLHFLRRLVPLTRYERKAAVRFGSLERTIAYPVQGHVDQLGEVIQRLARSESAARVPPSSPPPTLRAWLLQSFGPTLCELFFFPFHDRYTAGLADVIAPQDDYKSPTISVGELPAPRRAGYNAEFRYPDGGLDRLVAAMADQCDVRYSKRLVAIDTQGRALRFGDGTEQRYDEVISTVPLHYALHLAGLDVGTTPDPHTSVLVINIGAERGPACPDVHWQYEPDAPSGFHRIGFYSNVDRSFLPRRFREHRSAVSLYAERAFRAGEAPDPGQVDGCRRAVVADLRARGYIGEVHVADPSWVDVAYTWQVNGSRWRENAIAALETHGIHQVGRYGCWHFQGIADSVRDGLEIGRKLSIRL